MGEAEMINEMYENTCSHLFTPENDLVIDEGAGAGTTSLYLKFKMCASLL